MADILQMAICIYFLEDKFFSQFLCEICSSEPNSQLYINMSVSNLTKWKNRRQIITLTNDNLEPYMVNHTPEGKLIIFTEPRNMGVFCVFWNSQVPSFT